MNKSCTLLFLQFSCFFWPRIVMLHHGCVKILDFRKITIFRWSTYCTFVNTILTHIKIGTSVEWNCSNNLSKYWNTSTSFKHFTSTSNIWKSSKINFFSLFSKKLRDDFQIFDVLVKCLKLVDVFQYLDRLLLQFHSTLVSILIWVSTVLTYIL